MFTYQVHIIAAKKGGMTGGGGRSGT